MRKWKLTIPESIQGNIKEVYKYIASKCSFTDSRVFYCGNPSETEVIIELEGTVEGGTEIIEEE